MKDPVLKQLPKGKLWNKEKEYTKQTEEHRLKLWENHRRRLALEEHAPTPGTNPAFDDLQKPITTPAKTRYTSRDPHVRTQGGSSPAGAGHVPHSPVKWQPWPKEADEHWEKAPVYEPPAEACRSNNK